MSTRSADRRRVNSQDSPPLSQPHSRRFQKRDNVMVSHCVVYLYQGQHEPLAGNTHLVLSD